MKKMKLPIIELMPQLFRLKNLLQFLYQKYTLMLIRSLYLEKVWLNRYLLEIIFSDYRQDGTIYKIKCSKW